MEMVAGESILGQIAFGRLHFFQRIVPEPIMYSTLSWEQEHQRLLQAQRQAVLALAALYDRAVGRVGEGTAAIFAIHAMLLEDEELLQAMLAPIRDAGATAEYAVQTVGNRFAADFAKMESSYMRARAADIRDICRRVLFILLGLRRENPLREGAAILVADEFLPSEVMELDQRRLLGIISRRGSVDSHTALLLKAYGIPAMAQVDLPEQWDGHLALLDGFGHRLYLDPQPQLIQQLRLRYQQGNTAHPPSCE